MLPRPTRIILSVLVVFLAMGPLVRDARAETLRSVLTKGNQLFAAGEYKAAHDVFKTGYEKSQTPVFLRSMAFCLLKLYRHADAQALLQQYLAKFPKAQDLDKIKKTLGDLDVVVATTVRVRSTPSGADLYIDAEAATLYGVELTGLPVTTQALDGAGIHQLMTSCDHILGF